MPEKSNFWKAVASGLIVSALSPIAMAVGTWLLLKFHQLRDPAIAFLHRLMPTTEEALTIFLCLFVAGVLNSVFSFVISYRNARRRIELERRRVELINTKLADLKSGKIDGGSLTLEEMYILRDKLPKQPWKYEKENEARGQARLDQIRERL